MSFEGQLRVSHSGAGLKSGSELTVYQDAPHGFNADYRASYRKEAAEDGWMRMLAWFNAHGAG